MHDKNKKRKVCTTKNVTKQKTVDDSVKYCRLIDTEASCNDVGGIYVKQRFCQNKTAKNTAWTSSVRRIRTVAKRRCAGKTPRSSAITRRVAW